MMGPFADYLLANKIDTGQGPDYGEALWDNFRGGNKTHSVIASIKGHEKMWKQYVDYFDQGFWNKDVRMQMRRGLAPRYGGPPAELKGFAHDGYSYGVDALFFIFYRAYLLGFFDFAPAALTNYIPDDFIGITTPELFERVFKKMGLVELRRVQDPVKGPAVIVHTKRADLWKLFFSVFTNQSAEFSKDLTLQNLNEDPQLKARLMTSPLVLPTYSVARVEVEDIPIFSCASAYMVKSRVFDYFNPPKK